MDFRVGMGALIHDNFAVSVNHAGLRQSATHSFSRSVLAKRKICRGPLKKHLGHEKAESLRRS
jgi:hypothetical protein